MRQADGGGALIALRRIGLALLFAGAAQAAVDGTVTNSSTGKPQAGATVTLFQPTSQGPQFIDSVKTDAQGKFQITKEVPAGGAGPLLLQAVYAGVQYNKMLPPGTPTSDVQIAVFESSKRPGGAKVSQHMILLEPAPGGNLQVSESYVFENDGKTTWNDPDHGTLQFSLPAAAQGQSRDQYARPWRIAHPQSPGCGPEARHVQARFPDQAR